MRCTYLLNNEFALLPEMLSWVGLELARTVEDAPDAWCFLRESYIKQDGGIPVKNFERWLYQRDAPGYETTPALKIDQAIKMWMVDPDRYYDYIARKGKRIGFRLDDNFLPEGQHPLAIKISYYDGVMGEFKLVFMNTEGKQERTIATSGNDQVKTATFFVDVSLNNPVQKDNFDFEIQSRQEVPVSFVRVIKIP